MSFSLLYVLKFNKEFSYNKINKREILLVMYYRKNREVFEMYQIIGKTLMTIGLTLLLAGVVAYFGEKIGIGKLPGDIVYKKGNIKVYFPIVTIVLAGIVISLISSLVKFIK